MAEPDLQLAGELPESLITSTTPAAWLDVVLADFPSFLQDHASCEKKASGMALNVASHYPDKPRLLSAMADLAVEELGHYREVVRLLLAKGLQPGPDSKDANVRELNAQVRRGSDNFLLDRLLVAAVVEARGAERFQQIADALPAGTEQKFYSAIAASEARHWKLFVELALQEFSRQSVHARIAELIDFEAKLIATLPLAPRLH